MPSRRFISRVSVGLVLFIRLSNADTFSSDWLQQDKPPFIIRYTADGGEFVAATFELLKEAKRDFSANLSLGDSPVIVILCTNPTQFRMYAGAYSQPKIGGIARPEEGIVVLKTPRFLGSFAEYRSVLRHELVHILLARNTETGRMPSWLNEGIAMELSGERRWQSVMHVALMYLRGQIIPYRDLDWAFEQPGIEREFGNAYAQSLLMTKYLRKRLGDLAFWELVVDLKSMSFGDALRKKLGMSPPEFFDEWIASLWKLAVVGSVVSGFGLFQAAAILVVLAFLRQRRRGKEILERWALEEAESESSDAVFDEEEDMPWEEDDLDDEENRL
ncbi:MAG TPA: hypothetical protein PKY35_09870 [Candidatus Hydrogenedentes bacterium]|nr:hypothetical protein [Candidatus Hydrogenedentota bacterium]HOL77326.1 hypothetical protein [Candidatus Hydrogenedentota bacterium]HPO85968.1 hypothetical protein [Candidatus Hydrogenedentota bacterium]